MEIEYKVSPPVASQQLNALFSDAWPAARQDGDFGSVLRRSLGYVCAYQDGELAGFVNVAWDGCEFVHLYADPDDANHLFLLEHWESRAKYEKYREWAMAQPASNDMMSMVERDPTWTYLDDTGV
jgi:hypothetical protein